MLISATTGKLSTYITPSKAIVMDSKRKNTFLSSTGRLLCSHNKRKKNNSEQHCLANNGKAKQNQIRRRIQHSNQAIVRMDNSRQHGMGSRLFFFDTTSSHAREFI